MVPDLVGDDVGAREVARRASAAELAEELEVEIHLPVGRAVEGTDRGAGLAARGVNRPAEEHQSGGSCGSPPPCSESRPQVSSMSPSTARMKSAWDRPPAASARSAVDGRGRGVPEAAEEIQRIRPVRTLSTRIGAARRPQLQPRPAHRHSATILDVAAAAQVTPSHRDLRAAVRTSGLHLRMRQGAAAPQPAVRPARGRSPGGGPLYRRPEGRRRYRASLEHPRGRRPSRLRDRAGTVPLFSNLGRLDLARLAGELEEMHFAPGQAIVRQGDRPDGLYVIKHGRAAVLADPLGFRRR